MDAPELTPERCAEWIRQAERVVALTGAGISTAAGLPDFRGPDGLYVTRRYDPETVFAIDHFRRDPAPFYAFTRDLLGVLEELEPTFTHRFLARLEATGALEAVITQNIDPLHEEAGSRRVLPVHGGYRTSRCLACGRTLDFPALTERLAREAVPRCACGGVFKPEVVFFGEPVRELDAAVGLVSACDLLLVLGSSLTVQPVAALPRYAGGRVVVVNLGPVALQAGPQRRLVASDLDAYFRPVAAALGLTVPEGTDGEAER